MAQSATNGFTGHETATRMRPVSESLASYCCVPGLIRLFVRPRTAPTNNGDDSHEPRTGTE